MELLTPFSYHQWKEDIEKQLRSKRLFRLTMDTKAEPIHYVNKKKYWNRLDESYECLCLSISQDLLFHPANFKTLNDFFTKFKHPVFQLKLCKVEKEDDQLILSILSKITVDYSFFVSNFQLVRLSTPNRKMPTLDAFIASLTYEHD